MYQTRFKPFFTQYMDDYINTLQTLFIALILSSIKIQRLFIQKTRFHAKLKSPLNRRVLPNVGQKKGGQKITTG